MQSTPAISRQALSPVSATTKLPDALTVGVPCSGGHTQMAAHTNMPARVVLHKSSYFTPEDTAGFKAALQQERVAMADMLSIRTSSIRLFRPGQYPVLRGTHMSLGPNRHLLYTRGSVPFFETYPGLYVPRALEVQLDAVERSRDALCLEILALTKMNWNSTQFDMRDPITLHAARRVGDILMVFFTTAFAAIFILAFKEL